MKNNLILVSILSTALTGCVENLDPSRLDLSRREPQTYTKVVDLYSTKAASLTSSSAIWDTRTNKIKYNLNDGFGALARFRDKLESACTEFLKLTTDDQFDRTKENLEIPSPKTGLVLRVGQSMKLSNTTLGLVFMSPETKLEISQGSHIDYLLMKQGEIIVDGNVLKIAAGVLGKNSKISSTNAGTIEIANLISIAGSPKNFGELLEENLGKLRVEGTINSNLTVSSGSSINLITNSLVSGELVNSGSTMLMGGTINGTVKNGDGARFYITSGRIEKSFKNSGGAVYFNGGKGAATILGKFTSKGQSKRDHHRNNTVRLTMGPNSLTTGPIEFDKDTKIFVNFNKSDTSIPLVKSTGDIKLAQANFELNLTRRTLSDTLKKGKYILFQTDPVHSISNLNTTLTGAKTDKCKLTIEGDNKVVMLEVLEDIARPLDSRKKPHPHMSRHHGHPNDCARSHISSIQTGIAFDAKANQTSLTNGLSLTTSENSEKSYQFMAMDQKIGSESFGVYAGYAAEKNTIRDFGAYQMSSFGSFNVTNHFGFSGNTDEKFEDGIQFNADSKSLFATSQISLPVSFGNFTFAPKIGLGYNQLIDAKNSFTEEREVFNVSSSSNGSFEGVIGLDITSKFNINGIALESFASLNFTSELGSQNITETSVEETFSYTDSYSFVDFKAGINGTLDAHSKMYATFKTSSEKNDTDSTKAFEVGMNFKI